MTLPTACVAVVVAADNVDETAEAGEVLAAVAAGAGDALVDVAAAVGDALVDVAAAAGDALAAVAAAAGDALVEEAWVVAGVLDAEPEPASVDGADWSVDAAWPTPEDTSAATEELSVAAVPPDPFWAVEVPGLVAAEADRAVRRANPMATPAAAMATPAAHTQNRRIRVTSPLVTTVTVIRSGLPV